MILASDPFSPLFALVGLAIAVAGYLLSTKLPSGGARRFVSQLSALFDLFTPFVFLASASLVLLASGFIDGSVGSGLAGIAGLVAGVAGEVRRRRRRSKIRAPK